MFANIKIIIIYVNRNYPVDNLTQTKPDNQSTKVQPQESANDEFCSAANTLTEKSNNFFDASKKLWSSSSEENLLFKMPFNENIGKSEFYCLYLKLCLK